MATNQGDLVSSLLFNTVLQMALKDGVERWQKSEGMGDLRFADDVLLFYFTGAALRNDV